MNYKIVIRTGDELYSGTDSTVEIKIIGSEGETNLHKLDKTFRNDFERWSTNSFKFKSDDVGDIECIILKIQADFNVKDIWYINYIQVVKDPPHGKSIYFPIFQWIAKNDFGRELIFSTNKTCIPQKDSEKRTMENRRARQLLNDTVQWHIPMEGEPKHLSGKIKVEGTYEQLNPNVRFTNEKWKAIKDNYFKAQTSGMWSELQSKFQTFDSFDDYKRFCQGLIKEDDMPVWTQNDLWKNDVEFGRQTLNGVNPGLVEKCREIPENFPVTDNHVKGLLAPGTTLEKEVANGKIYIINHKILDGVSTGVYAQKQIELAAAICMFYVRNDGEFVPIAIQHGQNSNRFPIWTPNDKELDWLMAKLWFRNSDTVVHSVYSHITGAHFVTEPFAIALHRCLPPVHPIHKLLREHLQFVIAINTIVRPRLFQADGKSDSILSIGHGSKGMVELLERSFSIFDLHQELNFSKNIEKRGVEDIPKYWFCDDGLKLWNAIHEYAKDVIDIFYLNDKEVVEDTELQKWNTEVLEYGYKLSSPEEIRTKEELIKMCTMVIFHSSVRHSSVNFPSFDYACFAPVSPVCMRGKIPAGTDRGKITEQDILNSLPDPILSIRGAGIAMRTSEYSQDEVFLLQTTKKKNKRESWFGSALKVLGLAANQKPFPSLQDGQKEDEVNGENYATQMKSIVLPPRWLFNEDEVKLAFGSFQKKLEKIEEGINIRNKELDIPYAVLLPSKIPFGIAI